VTPNRQLSFQGRLENASGTPVTGITPMTFKLFTASSGGSELYSTGSCNIDPDTDGVFNTQIGDTCGSAIASTVFTENQDVWLEVTVDAEVLDPRQQIATVAYALNSETLQGFPLSSTVSAIKNSVVAMNQWGEILVGEQSPRLTAVSGTFQISAPALSFVTATGTNGNITLAPDGTGQVNINGNTTSTNFFNVSNAQLTTGSLITGTAANNNSGFKLLDLLSGASPTSKFSVADDGDVITAGTITLPNTNTLTGVTNYLQASQGISVGGGTTYYINSSGTANLNAATVNGTLTLNSVASVTDNNQVLTLDSGVTKYINTTAWDKNGNDDLAATSIPWIEGAGILYPKNSTVDLLVGGQATSSAKFAVLNMNGGTPTASISGTTANVATFLDGNGNLSSTNRNNITIGNSTTYNTTGNVLINPNGTGNVGIGTTSPTVKLDVRESSLNIDAVRILYSTGISAGLGVDGLGSNYGASIFYGGTKQATFYNTGLVLGTYVASGADAPAGGLVVSGDVGLGTTTPTAKLDIAGDASTSASLVFRSTSPTIDLLNNGTLTFQSSVGGDTGLGSIATLSPVGNLGLNGDLTITGDDLYMATNTAGMLLIADGTNFNPTAMSGDITIDGTGATAIGDNKVVEADLKAVDTASDEECLTYETTTGDFEWQSCAAASMTSFTAAGDSGGGQAITDGNTLSILGGTNGIDTVDSATDTVTINLDTAEVGTTTWGSGAAVTWTFDASAGTDTTIAFGDNTQTFTAATVAVSGDLKLTGADILDTNGNEFLRFTAAASAVDEVTIANAAANGVVTIAATGGDTDIALSIDSKGADALNLNGTATGDVNIAGGSGSTGCTIANSTGNLTCSGNISSSATSGTQGWWSRTTGNLSPVNLNDTLSATTSAAVAMTITQTGAFNALLVQDEAGDTTPFVIDQNGNIGIGTPTPSTLLYGDYSVDGSGVSNVFSLERTDPNTPLNDFGVGLSFLLDRDDIAATATESGRISMIMTNITTAATAMTFSAKAADGSVTEYMRLDSTGNIGLRTTAPDAALEINHATGDNLRLTYNDADGSAAAYTDFSLASDGDLTIDSAGGAINISDILNFAGGTTYYVDAAGNAKFNDLIAADTENPGLTVGNGTTGYFKVGGSTISDAAGDLTLDSDTTKTVVSDDLEITGDLIVADDSFIGLGSAAGRFVFDATTTPDTITVSDANLSLGANAIVGTTGIIDYTNFDVNASGDITTAGNLHVNGDSIDSDGELAITGATRLVLQTLTGETVIEGSGILIGYFGTNQTVAIGAGGTGTGTINIGTGLGSDTITIGGGGADYITLGGGTGSVTINTSSWDINEYGDMTDIRAITADGTLTVDNNATISGTLTIGNGATNVIQPPFGPLTLNYKSAANTWAAGITIQDTTGYVGISDTTPSYTLDVAGNLRVAQTSDAQDNGILIRSNTLGYANYIWNDSSANLNIDAGSTGARNIILNGSGTGNVGIGTTAPGSRLEVSGGATYLDTLASPTIGTVTCTTTGGTLAAGTYYYRVSYLDGNNIESQRSTEASDTVASGTTGKCSVAWTNISGVTTYKVYGRIATTQDQYWTDTDTPYSDTGTTGTSGFPLVYGMSLETYGNITANGGAVNGRTGSNLALIGDQHITVHLDEDNTGAGSFIVYDGLNAQLFNINSTGVASDLNTELKIDLNEGTATEAVCSDATDAAGGGANSLLYDCSGTPVADYMEFYPTAPDVQTGDIVISGNEYITTDTGDRLTKLIKTTSPYQSGMIGIISNPDNAGDFNSIGYNIKDADRPLPLALNGRVPVKISSTSPAINVGDPITSSNDPGKGMKATNSGRIVGTALEEWHPDNPSDTIMVFVSNTYYDPDLAISNTGDVTLSGNPVLGYTVTTPSGITEKIGAFAQATIGKIRAGITRTDSLEVGTISPLASDQPITIDAPTVIKDQHTSTPDLIVEGEIAADSVSSRIAKLDTLEVKEIIADRIIAGSIEGLDAKIATLSARTTSSLSDTDLTTLTESIKARLQSLVATDSATAVDLPTPPEATDSAIQDTTSFDFSTNVSTDSATLLTADINFVTVNNYLAVIGSATITQLSVTDTLLAHSIQAPCDPTNVSDLTSNSSCLSTLALQPLGGTVNLAQDTLIVDSSGQVSVNGDLSVTGTLALHPSSTDPSPLGKLLQIYNEKGVEVGSINASGSANLAELTTKLVTIASPATATASSSLITTTTTSNATAGNAILVSPNTELTIVSPFVTPNSLVYLTPTGNGGNKVLFVKSKTSCTQSTPSCEASFTVGIDAPATSDIPFNWWIIQLEQPQ